MKSLLFFLLLPLAHAEPVSLKSGKIEVKLLTPKNQMGSFEVKMNGKVIQKNQGMGITFRPISVHGEKSDFVKADLDGDGNEELLIQANWNVSSTLEVFRWVEKTQRFHPTLVSESESLLFLPADAELDFDPAKKTILVTSNEGTKLFSFTGRRFEAAK